VRLCASGQCGALAVLGLGSMKDQDADLAISCGPRGALLTGNSDEIVEKIIRQ